MVKPPEELTVFNSSSSTHAVRRDTNIFIFVLLGFLPLFSQSVIVLNKLHHLLHLLTDVDALIFAILVCTSAHRRRKRTTHIMLWILLLMDGSFYTINYCSFEQMFIMFYSF